MKTVFSLLCAVIILTLVSSFAIADIQISVDKQIYNLGDQISINVSTIENKTINGFLKMQLICTNLSFQFYLLPVVIEQNKEKQVTVSLPVSEQMIGNCNIDASLTDFSNNVIAGKASDKFNITNELFGYFRIDKEVYKPGEEIIIGGYIKKASGEGFIGKLDIYFDGVIVKTIDIANNFEYNLKTEDAIKSGKHFVKIAANDKNKAEKEFATFVESEPRKLIIDVKQQSYLPEETVKASISLKDQAGDDIRQDVAIDLIAPSNNWLGSWKIDSSSLFEYKLDKFSVPGNYILRATFGTLVAETNFNVSELRKLDFDIFNNTILIENTGNVIYDDIVEVYLESQKKRYLVEKKIKLAPGEQTVIELYKEVPDDSYNVTVPLVPLAQNISAEVSESSNDSIKVTDIIVKDERTIVQKSEDTINEIIGAFLGGGALSYLSLFIMVILLSLFVVLHIMRLRGKPPKTDTEKKEEAKKKEINAMLQDFIKK